MCVCVRVCESDSERVCVHVHVCVLRVPEIVWVRVCVRERYTN